MTQHPATSIALIVPVYNAAKDIPYLLPAIMQQTLKPDQLLFIDSSSTDNTATLLSNYPVTIHTIKQSDFDHGGTRKLATTLVDADIYIYLTQDAYPADRNAFAAIVHALQREERIACAYGRQLPKASATPISAHARLFNYPEQSQIKSFSDRDKYGIKTCFNSDSFSAYKKQALTDIGNFPEHLITGEDAYVAAKLLKAGYAIAYAADAVVLHSHNLTLTEEFHRYFSIGVFHGKENWLLKDFHSATGEGMRFVKSEINYLLKQHKIHWLPKACLSTCIKYIAYQLGIYEKKIPLAIKRNIGINKSYWLNPKVMTA